MSTCRICGEQIEIGQKTCYQCDEIADLRQQLREAEAKAAAMLAVVEAADAWDKAKRGTDHGESFCHASDALSAAVDAWRKAGGK
jgi:predicted nucleic acid-binding Zn ribbon protein